MKVLVEIFDGNTVRGMLVSREELKNFVQCKQSKALTTKNNLPRAQKWRANPSNRNKTL
jgi:hypothetical protein